MAKKKLPEGIREKIGKKRDDILSYIDKYGWCDGSEIATYEEMHWLAEQMALRGVLFTFSADNSVYRQGDETYFYFDAISAYEKREKVMEFLSNHPVLSSAALKELLPAKIESEEQQRVSNNVKRVRRPVMAYWRKRRREEQERQREVEEKEREEREAAEREAAMQEAYDHRDDVAWLISRIEAQGFLVTVSSKPQKEEEEPSGLGPVKIFFTGKSISEEQERDYFSRIDIVYPEDADYIEKKLLTTFVVQYAEKILSDTSEEQTRISERNIRKAWMEMYGEGYRDFRTKVSIERGGEKVKVVFTADFIY